MSRYAQDEQSLERLGPMIVAGIAANPLCSVKRALNALRPVLELGSKRARRASTQKECSR